MLKILETYNSIPNQLAKENKKFQYSKINSHANARGYLDSIVWLEEYGLITRCYNLNCLELPLEGNKDDSIFKIYINDTGLFILRLRMELPLIF